MNIDDLKDAWKNEEPGTVNFSNETLKGKTSSAIDNIRRTMRNELIGTIISYFIMAGFLFRHPQSPLFFNFACVMLFALTLLLCYYFARFYAFYKSIKNYNTSLKESVSKAAYELELNMELYKAFNLCTAPMAVVIALGIVWGQGATEYITKIFSTGFTSLSALITFGSIFIMFVATYFFIGLHVKLNYGKHLKALKSIIADLQAE